jgi:hypothetical protein
MAAEAGRVDLMPQLPQHAGTMGILKLKRGLKVPQERSREQAIVSRILNTVYERLLDGDKQLGLKNMRVNARQVG